MGTTQRPLDDRHSNAWDNAAGLNVIDDIRRRGGWVLDAELPVLVRVDRLRQLLVRCGSCRFVAAAQDVGHIIAAIEAHGDYVRDVSLVA